MKYEEKLNEMTNVQLAREWEKVTKEVNPKAKKQWIDPETNSTARVRVLGYVEKNKELKPIYCCDNCGASLMWAAKYCGDCKKNLDWIKPIVSRKAKRYKVR